MDKYGEAHKKKHWEDATRRAKYWQKGALVYRFVEEVPAPYGNRPEGGRRKNRLTSA